MNRNRPVLVTTDGSAHSHRVLPHAALLAGVLGAGIALLGVAEGEDVATIEASLDSTLKRLGIEGATVTEARRERESIAAAVLRAAAALDAAVIAMDSRGHDALRHVLHGSVMQELLRSSDRPLLVSGPNLEPPPSRAQPYRMLVTNDGSPASEAVLHALGALLPAAGFELTLLRVHEHEPGGKDDAAALAACKRELARARQLLPASLAVETQVRQIPRGGGIDTAIIEKALELNAHAIAMSTHGLSARKHVFLGSVGTTMLGRSPLPLLLSRSEV
jgi:nucleotide-binding universal stress UspA family protein